MSDEMRPPHDDVRWDGAWQLHTESGSVYELRLAPDGTYWFGGRNVPNPWSVALDGQLWRVQQPVPFPPVLGEPIWVRAPVELDRDDPCRIPGGGKLTTPLVAIVTLQPPA